jgi:hypothetical protein
VSETGQTASGDETDVPRANDSYLHRVLMLSRTMVSRKHRLPRRPLHLCFARPGIGRSGREGDTGPKVGKYGAGLRLVCDED